MNVCRFGYKRSDGKCALNGKKCRTTCGSNVDVDVKPKTVKDVLLKRWAQDTERLAAFMVNAYFDGRAFVFNDGFVTENGETAIEHQITYLNSPAEVEA